MSLTSFLENNSDVRDKFKQEFEKVPLRIKKDILAPPLTKNYSTIGTAFDYILRFYVKRLNKEIIDVNLNKGYWIAELSLGMLSRKQNLYAKAKDIILKAKELEKAFIETGEITDDLISSALSLAYLDPIFRARRGHDYIGKSIDKKDIKDIKKLISIVNPEYFKSQKICLLNPVFCESGLVGGADADLVIDDHLIEIKTSKNLELRLRHFQQLVGYYVLYHIGGFPRVEPKQEIKRLSIYFSRYAYLHTIEVKNLINQDTFPDFVEWFQERAKQEY